MNSKLLTVLLTSLGAGLAYADFNPVALTPSSYTYDIVVEANTVQALPYCINVTAGDGVGLGDNTYYEQGLWARPGASGANSGLPVHNTTFTSINEPGVTFRMPPDYTVNNELMVDSTFSDGILLFSSPTTATNLAILCSGGGGPLTVNYTVYHSDNSTETGTLNLLDWFSGGSTVAWGANGRISVGGGFDSVNSSAVNNNPPYLYANHIAVSGASPVTSVELNSPSGHHGNFYAISGNAAGANWTPIPLDPSSFNVIATVPAAIPFPVTATMDNGTNLSPNGGMNTWFEQGFVRGVSGGLPPSGSVFNSQSQGSHHYQMGDYSTNNAVLIDATHQSASMTPASPASYSALAFLTAGANINGQMTNICIIQHADGVNETNYFLAYDWFDSNHSGAIALQGSGRVSMQNRTVNNVGNNVPFLFESYFTLTDASSPVTNIVVQYYLAPGGSSTTWVMAISASEGGIAPVITSGPLPATQTLFPGQKATFNVSVSGTAPLTNAWFVQVNGNFVQLNDGVTANGSVISGSHTNTLVISNLAVADSGTYEYMAVNAFGSQANTATLSVLAPGNSLEWSASDNNGIWDTANSANWTNLVSLSQTVFNTADQVLFDDTVGVPTTVTVNGSVMPSTMTVNSSVNNFTITGSGTLTGSGTIVKTGSSTLSLNVPANYTGTAMIEGGTVNAGYYVFANAAGITITNNATMDFAGSTMVNNTPMTVSGNGVGGKGAIFNSGYGLYGQVLNITLAGDTTFGASSRWDLGTGAKISGPYHLTMDWSAGGGYAEWIGLTIGANVAGITLTNGSLGLKNMDTGFQNPATVLTVSPNCGITYYTGGWNGSLHLLNGSSASLLTAPSAFNGSTITMEDGVTWQSYYNSTPEPINSAITLNGVAHFIVGDHNMLYTNVISGPGGFVLDYWNHADVFSASNTYSGPTIINNGPAVALTGNGSISHSPLIFFGGSSSNSVHLDASGRSDSTWTLASGQTLGGIGGVAGNLTVAAGATIAPAGTNITIFSTNTAVAGAITATGNITLRGTTVLKLNGSGVNDGLVAGGSLSYGGTLNVVNMSGAPLTAGSTFQLFSATAGISGSFDTVNLPALPAGLSWNTSQLGSGLISITGASGPTIASVKMVNGNLIFAGSGGSASGGYVVLTATNLLTPAANWVPIQTNSFDAGGNFSVTNAASADVPQKYYRIIQSQ